MQGTKPSGGRGVRIKAQSVSAKRAAKTTKRLIWAQVCYYYPQYTLEQASMLSMRDIRLLLKVAKSERARELFALTQIAAAPHTEKGKGVKQLSDYFQKEFD